MIARFTKSFGGALRSGWRRVFSPADNAPAASAPPTVKGPAPASGPPAAPLHLSLSRTPAGAAGAAAAGIDGLRAELSGARDVIATLRAKVADAERARDAARAGQKAAEAAKVAAEKERDAAKARADRTREEVRCEVRNQEMMLLAASAGVPPDMLPPAQPGVSVGMADAELAALRQEISGTKDPERAGKLAAQASAIREARHEARERAAAAAGMG